MWQQILDLKLVSARDDAFLMSPVKMVNCSKIPLHYNRNFFWKVILEAYHFVWLNSVFYCYNNTVA